jgi:hypothetical protein
MDDRPLFLFCDANTAVYDTHLLVKQGGLQLVRLLRELRGKIALPDISRTEYLSNYAKVAAKAHIVADEQVVKAVLQGYTNQIDTLNARELFLMVDPLASCLTPDEADEVLNFGMSLLEDVLRPEDGDGPWRDELIPPASCEEALAGYLWVGLGSPVAASRWEAAHAVRGCIELGWSDLLSALVGHASAGDATPFVDGGLTFYEWHARQWLLIGLARGAVEQPAAVLPFLPFLFASVKEEHVVIRHFAALALKALHIAGHLQPEDVNRLSVSR